MTAKAIFISTGEVSGDLQGAMLVEALQRQAKVQGLELNIVALGGEKMAQAGATLLANTTGIGSVGLLESLPFVLPTLQIQRRAKQYLQKHPPDLVVLIDYISPNLVIGSFIRSQLPQVPVVYYIAPQDWVWSVSSRNTKMIVGITNRLLAIFPEEARYFSQKGASVKWVGHPLVDRMQGSPNRRQARAALEIAPEQTVITLIPASRRQELKYLLPIVGEAARQLQWKLKGDEGDKLASALPLAGLTSSQTASHSDPLFLIPLSLEEYRPTIEEAIKQYGLNAKVIAGKTIEVLAAADLAITKSGTVNLELALLNVPQVVVYRVSPFTAWLARTFLNFSIPFMSPPNLVVMREIVPELLQEKATPENIVQEALGILLNRDKRKKILTDYQKVVSLLGDVGVCDRAALEIIQLARETEEGR